MSDKRMRKLRDLAECFIFYQRQGLPKDAEVFARAAERLGVTAKEARRAFRMVDPTWGKK